MHEFKNPLNSLIQCFCATHILDGMESMIHLFWVSVILSYEGKEKSWWVMNLLVSYL